MGKVIKKKKNPNSLKAPLTRSSDFRHNFIGTMHITLEYSLQQRGDKNNERNRRGKTELMQLQILKTNIQ